ncbi:MAG: DEAD/DEAH box helicase, partial [Verrucomicrobiae bacterium]|nr:DEAD/DEAH box helicase [Verrucomicrobiae bacterium]
MTDFRKSITPALQWMQESGKTPFAFQLEAWRHYLNGDSGIVNAPTGSGKTYSLMVPLVLNGLANRSWENRLQAIWITPIRALAREIQHAGQEVAEGLRVGWQISIRTGDTGTQERRAQIDRAPQILITTPESVHLLLATRGYADYFADMKVVIVDEWHELMGSKRGVQMELALSRLKSIASNLRIWGISATIGNMKQSMEVLFGNWVR